jgi:hypothetical protein
LWYFILLSGANSQPESLQEFRTVIPRDAGVFEIAPGNEYRIRVWGKSLFNRNSRRFTAPRIDSPVEATHNHRTQATACAVVNCDNYTRRAGARRA